MPDYAKRQDPSITALSVAGFKSIGAETTIELGYLTVLAGTNSSGKSSMMQPLLLLKQTLEAGIDPGSLLLNGPHVRFHKASDFLSCLGPDQSVRELKIGVHVPNGHVTTRFRQRGEEPFGVFESAFTTVEPKARFVAISLDNTFAPNKDSLDVDEHALMVAIEKTLGTSEPMRWNVNKERCFLYAQAEKFPFLRVRPGDKAARLVRGVIHVPALRGMPARAYQATAVGTFYAGTFENYTASLIAQWQKSDAARLDRVCRDLDALGLTRTASAKEVTETHIEIRVARLPKPIQGSSEESVNIADVGIGVSQVLPALVAVHAAQLGQLVYIEQPELHLHPGAQRALAGVFADAAQRRVRVVIETHSALLLKSLQTLVAEEKFDPQLLKLHWFERDDSGQTQVTSVDVDEDGSFGDWPVDFGEIELNAESRYIDAVDARHAKAKP